MFLSFLQAKHKDGEHDDVDFDDDSSGAPESNGNSVYSPIDADTSSIQPVEHRTPVCTSGEGIEAGMAEGTDSDNRRRPGDFRIGAFPASELRFPLPVGYVYDDDLIVMDPDEEVQMAVHNVFSASKASGSAYNGAWNGKLIWGRLTHGRVISILYNPSYTGAYVYGRYRDQKTVDQQGFFIHHQVRLPKEQWEVFIPDHHAGYITWEMYEANHKQL